jgi:hypothetical protein
MNPKSLIVVQHITLLSFSPSRLHASTPRRTPPPPRESVTHLPEPPNPRPRRLAPRRPGPRPQPPSQPTPAPRSATSRPHCGPRLRRPPLHGTVQRAHCRTALAPGAPPPPTRPPPPAGRHQAPPHQAGTAALVASEFGRWSPPHRI